MNTQQTFVYTGSDNLEVMRGAVNYNSFLVSLITKNLKPDDRVLDIGAGIGLFAELIQTKTKVKVSCFEPDPGQAELLGKKGFTTYVSLAGAENGSCDLVYALNVLEHIDDDTEALSLWSEKLKDGGRLLIYVPAFNVLFSSMDKKVGHFRRYTRKTLTRQIVASGLKPVGKVQYADSIGFFITLIYKMCNEGSGKISEKSLFFYDRFLFPLSRFCDLFFRNMFGKNVFAVVEKRRTD
jgi:SAM-dependent methyltransferase